MDQPITISTSCGAFRSPPLTESATWTHIGSIGAALSPGVDELEERLAALTGWGRLSYDPNIRAALMPPHGESVARFERLASQSDVVKLSDEDAAWLYPDRAEDFILDHLLELGCRVAAVTLGERGAWICTRDIEVQIPARQTTLVDTIGAGDSFMAALIMALHTTTLDLGYDELMRVGTVAAMAAAITVSRAGAKPPTLQELELALLMKNAHH